MPLDSRALNPKPFIVEPAGPAQGKKARMQREAAGNLRDLSKMAAQTLRESKRRMPKVLSWGRTN